MEQVLEVQPSVARVVVLGMPDQRYGVTVHAVLTLRDAAVELQSLHAA